MTFNSILEVVAMIKFNLPFFLFVKYQKVSNAAWIQH